MGYATLIRYDKQTDVRQVVDDTDIEELLRVIEDDKLYPLWTLAQPRNGEAIIQVGPDDDGITAVYATDDLRLMALALPSW